MKQSLRIAYLFDQRLPSTATDTEQVLNTLAALSRAGADVTLVLPRDWVRSDASAEELLAYYQVSCPQLKVKRLRSLSPAPRFILKPAHAMRAALYAFLSRSTYDLFYTRNIPSFITCLLLRLPVVYETYRPWPVQVSALRLLFRWAMKSSAFVGGVFHSDFARQTYVQLGIPEQRLEVVHNGFDPTRFANDPGAEVARERCGVNAEGLVFAYTGRVNLKKGLGMVLDLATRHEDVTFLIVGSEGEGEVERRAAKLQNVIIKPWATYDQLPDYLFAADVLIIPPSQGPLAKVGNTVLPMKLFQYLATGRAIFAPSAPDTAELLTHDENAYLVPPDDLERASQGIDELKSNVELRARLGSSAQSTSERLTWDGRAQRLIEFIQRRRSERKT